MPPQGQKGVPTRRLTRSQRLSGPGRPPRQRDLPPPWHWRNLPDCARNQASSANARVAANPADAEAVQGLIGAETALSGALGRLFALAEAYPDLKANQTMMQLMEELSTTENKIPFARQAYNDAVMTSNIGREKFPNMILAGAFGFTEAGLFEITPPPERRG